MLITTTLIAQPIPLDTIKAELYYKGMIQFHLYPEEQLKEIEAFDYEEAMKNASSDSRKKSIDQMAILVNKNKLRKPIIILLDQDSQRREVFTNRADFDKINLRPFEELYDSNKSVYVEAVIGGFDTLLFGDTIRYREIVELIKVREIPGPPKYHRLPRSLRDRIEKERIAKLKAWYDANPYIPETRVEISTNQDSIKLDDSLRIEVKLWNAPPPEQHAEFEFKPNFESYATIISSDITAQNTYIQGVREVNLLWVYKLKFKKPGTFELKVEGLNPKSKPIPVKPLLLEVKE